MGNDLTRRRLLQMSFTTMLLGRAASGDDDFSMVGDEFDAIGEHHPKSFDLLGSDKSSGATAPAPLGNLPRPNRTLFFTMQGCGPCESSKWEFPELQSVGWEIGESPRGHVQVVAAEKRPDLVAQYAVNTFPTWLHLHDGKQVGRVTGYMSAKTFVAWVNPLRESSPVIRQTQSPLNTSGHWTFPGDDRADLINHLVDPHNYTRQSLQNMSNEQLLDLHDSSHRQPATRRKSFLFFNFE